MKMATNGYAIKLLLKTLSDGEKFREVAPTFVPANHCAGSSLYNNAISVTGNAVESSILRKRQARTSSNKCLSQTWLRSTSYKVNGSAGGNI